VTEAPLLSCLRRAVRRSLRRHRSAFGPAIDRRPSAGLDRARPAITGSVYRHFSWKSAAMKRVALDRSLAGYGGPWSVGRWEPRNPTNGRQDKAPTWSGHVVGCAGFWHFRQRAAGAFGNFTSNSKDPSAIQLPFPRRRGDGTRDDELRIRPGRIQDGNVAPSAEDVRRRSDAGREEAGHTGKSFGGAGGRTDVRLWSRPSPACPCRRVRRGGELSS